MIWTAFLTLSIFIFVVLNTAAIFLYRRRKKIERPMPLRRLVSMFIVVTFFSAFFLLLPYFYEHEAFIDTGAQGIAAFFQTIRGSLQVFSLDGEYPDIYKTMESMPDLSETVIAAYQIFAAILYIAAPILLIGFVASFFQGVFARLRLRLANNENIYVFSELNEKSLALGRSCREHDRKNRKVTILVYTSVYDQLEEASEGLITRAKGIGAICLEADLMKLNVDFGKKRGDVRFLILGTNVTENIGYAKMLIRQYSACPNISVYVLTDSDEAKLIVGSAMNFEMEIQVRCIDSAQSMVYSYLYDMNEENNLLLGQMKRLASCHADRTQYSAPRVLPGGEKVLCVVLVGFGRYGTEMLRAMVWYTQIPGIRLEVHVFDRDPLAERKFASLCPELMEMNHNEIEGECRYDILFHRTEDGRGIDAETIEFDREILSLSDVAVAYVMLGEDEKNIRIAVKLRELFTLSLLKMRTQNTEKQSGNPQPDDPPEKLQPGIEAVVFDSQKMDLVTDNPLRSYSGREYGIRFIGDLESAWSCNRIAVDTLERLAMERHVKWIEKRLDVFGEEQKTEMIRREQIRFYQFEHNRKSSMSSMIRSMVRRQEGIRDAFPGIEKELPERTPREIRTLRELEHIAWNAYMRSEGYRYAPQCSDLAKCHNLLVPFAELPQEFREKGDSDEEI